MEERTTQPYGTRTISLGTPERMVTFGIDDLCRHTIVFGSSGSGKTTRAFNPMLQDMLLRLNAGAFVIAAKVEAVAEAVEIARRANRECLVIEPGSPVGLDLLSGSEDLGRRRRRAHEKFAAHVACSRRAVLHLRTPHDVLLR
jgi:type IV secretory pathway TraG/TraD family ATPase VirD4